MLRYTYIAYLYNTHIKPIKIATGWTPILQTTRPMLILTFFDQIS